MPHLTRIVGIDWDLCILRVLLREEISVASSSCFVVLLHRPMEE
jgi:hypothetical protein